MDREARILVREREWLSPPDKTTKRRPITGDYRIVRSGPSSIQPLDLDRNGVDDRILGMLGTPGSALSLGLCPPQILLVLVGGMIPLA